MNFADRLTDSIRLKNSCACVGLDPRLESIPAPIRKAASDEYGDTLEGAVAAILEFSRHIVDIVAPHMPAVKPQIAFYERYGWQGLRAYAHVLAYAKSKGLLVIADAKRGDIGSTAEAYADAHLGHVVVGSAEERIFQADALTVNPYLGWDSVDPFIETAKEHGAGIFVLVKTSNPSSADFQDVRCGDKRLYEIVAENVATWGKDLMGESGYSSVGAVVGATFPQEAAALRKLMPKAYFLVPGYGAQGATAKDVAPCFNPDGLGAIVNASRSIIFAHQSPAWRDKHPEADWHRAVEDAVYKMNEELRAVR